MFEIKVSTEFSAAHSLRGYKGKCEALHGHNWKVEVEAAGEKLDKNGMLLDFSLLKARLHKILGNLDHKYLNNIAYFKKLNPTSENIAKYIYDNLAAKIKGLRSVTVWESQNCRATYEE